MESINIVFCFPVPPSLSPRLNYEMSVEGEGEYEPSEYPFSKVAEAKFSVALSDLNKATKNFDDDFLIGSGAFGNVYKAKVFLDNQWMTVAVKKFKVSCIFWLKRGVGFSFGLDLFQFDKKLYRIWRLRNAELNALARWEFPLIRQDFDSELFSFISLEHDNIVKLLGQSADSDDDFCLLYEFMDGGNLKQALAKVVMFYITQTLILYFHASRATLIQYHQITV